MPHKHKHGMHLLGKHSNKKAVHIIKGIGKGAKGIAEEIKSFTPLGFLEKNPMMGTIILVGGLLVAGAYFMR